VSTEGFDRAAMFAALGEPVRLALVDWLVAGDASPTALAAELGVGSNLMAHHLGVLEDAGVIRRVRSEGDGRRSYIQLRLDNPTVRYAALSGAMGDHLAHRDVRRVIFVCTANSARSQLAAATWNTLSELPATSAGTHPSASVHPRAVKVGRRHGLDLTHAVPIGLDGRWATTDLVVAVCDNAHEELDPSLPRLHWSVPDPARADTDNAFEAAYADLDRRVHHLAALPGPLQPPTPDRKAS
jgi:ArsR family transcriptional regulator, arsenate/arsenite/antimonite-responsive transcriptional repressor / arsenate reductase (thioredoxin)